MTPVIPKLTKSDVDICKAFRALVVQGKFEIQGAALKQAGSMFTWFDSLDKRIEETLKPVEIAPVRKEVGIDTPTEKRAKK